MEKPTGVIQKIIESLQQVNALDVYSPIEKDIILHNLRAAYMIFLNVSVKEESTENRVEQLFVQEKEERGKEEREKGEEVSVGTENLLPEEETIEKETEFEKEETEFEQQIEIFENEILESEISEEEILEEEILEEEILEEEILEEEILEEEILEEEIIEEEIIEVEFIEEEVTEIPNVITVAEKPEIVVEISELPLTPAPHDDILEFIPDAHPHPQPQANLLFEETVIIRPEKKSLNDLLTEKKENHSLGAHFQQSGIPDLTKAIAINEKFTFIRELFRNSGVDFSNAIQKLNECENIETAFDLMEELKHQYLWDTTSSTYLSLCDLVRRRFL